MPTCLAFLIVFAMLVEDAAPSQVVVLANDATITGQVARVPDGFRITTGRGEQVIAAERVVAICANYDEAYRALRERANLRDADERIRLARWCRQNGMLEICRQEVTAALALDPRHRVALAMQRMLEHPEPVVQEAPTRPAKPVGEKPRPSRLPTDMPRLTDAQITEYTRRVQPILRNSCGTGACHGSERDHVAFRLAVPLTANGFTPGQTQKNLDQVWLYIDRQNWQQSPLLSHALRAHGNSGKPPLHASSLPYQTLANWVRGTSGGAPSTSAPKAVPEVMVAGGTGFASDQIRTPATAAPPTTIAPEGPKAKENTTDAVSDPPKPREPGTSDPRSGPEANRTSTKPETDQAALEKWLAEALNRRTASKPAPGAAAPPQPAANTKPSKPEPSRGPTTDLPTDASVDPFDAGPFNRRYHPERNSPSPKQ